MKKVNTAETPDINFLLDDPEVMTMALRVGLLQPMLDASRQSPGADRFIVSPPLIVNGLFTCIVYFYGYAEATDNGWGAIQTRDAPRLVQAVNNLPVKSIDRRTPLKGAPSWN